MTSTSTEPVLRTTLGTPRQEPVAPRTESHSVLTAGATAGAGLGVAIASLGGWLFWRRRQTARTAPVAGVRVAVVLAILGISAVLVWFRARAWNPPKYIGTPGVESALGRDLTQTGELPPEMGFEHPYQ